MVGTLIERELMQAKILFTDNKRYLDDTQRVCVGEEVIIGIENCLADNMTPAQMMALKAFVSIKEKVESVMKEDI